MEKNGPLKSPHTDAMAWLRQLPPTEKDFIAGLFSGVIQAGLFNPWDRALYLSVKDKRRFLHKENWKNPYTGCTQSILIRTLSGGLYFPLFDIFSSYYSNRFQFSPNSLLLSFLAGNSAGAVSGCCLNGFTAIKYHSWGTGDRLVDSAMKMYRDGGLRPFFKGVCPTVLRDTVFGGMFASLKFLFAKMLRKSDGSKELLFPLWPFNALAGGLATICSSPFNYVRNIKYGTPAGKSPPTTISCLSHLTQQAIERPDTYQYLQQRLRLGWGTARVAVGMSVGYELYDFAKLKLQPD